MLTLGSLGEIELQMAPSENHLRHCFDITELEHDCLPQTYLYSHTGYGLEDLETQSLQYSILYEHPQPYHQQSQHSLKSSPTTISSQLPLPPLATTVPKTPQRTHIRI